MRLAARNLGSNYLAYAAAILSGLVLTPVIIGAIGQEAYGAWAFIVSATTILRLLDFGITPTVVRFTAFHRGRDAAAADEIGSLASASFALYLLVGLFSVAAGLVLAWLLPDMLDLSPDLERPAQVAAVIAVLTLGTQAPLGLFGSLLKGAQRFDILNVGALVSILAYAALVLAVLTQEATLPVLATIALVATMIRLLYPLLFIRRVLPGLRLSRALVSRGAVRSLLSFSWFAFLGHAAGKVVYSADLILIGAFLGAKAVALYAVASRLFGLASGVASTGTELLLPLQSELEGRAEHERQRAFVLGGVRASMCVALLLSVPLVVLPSWILTAWLGEGFESSAVPLALLGLAVAFTLPNGVLSQFLFARGRPVRLAIAQSTLATANLSLTAGLLLGVGEIWVAALATLAVESIGAMLVLPLLARRAGVPLGAFFASWGAPVVAAAIAALPTLVLARWLTDTDSLLVLALVGAAWSVAFGAVAWRIGLTASERSLVRSLTARRRRTAEADVPDSLA